MKHTFDVEIATKYGIEEAILLENLVFWINKNQANKRHLHDGKYWTYNSARAFTELFPYMSRQKIGRALQHLEDENLIVSGNYNIAAYDHTKWYALGTAFLAKNGDETASELIAQNKEIDVSNLSNRYIEIEQPIPDINTDVKPDKKGIVGLGNSEPQKAVASEASSRAKDPTVSQKDIREIVDYLNAKAGTKYKASSKATQRLIQARVREGFAVDDFKTVIDHKTSEWKDSEKMSSYLRPVTLFGTKFEAYLNQQPKQDHSSEYQYAAGYSAEDLEQMFSDRHPNIKDIPDDELPF